MPTAGGARFADRVRATLRQHGLPGHVAETIWRQGRALQTRTRRTGTEFAALHDLGTGVPVGGVIQGTDTVTDIRPHLLVMQAGRRYVQLHTHPRSSALSTQDAILLTSHPRLAVSVVVGLDGTWYVLSKPAGAAPAPALVGQRYRQEVAARTPAYQARIQAGELTPQAAWRDHTHQAWLATAPQVGLRYDRVEPTATRS